MVAAFTGWIDSRNDPTKAVVLGDDSPVDAKALLDVSEFMMDNRVSFKWQKDDVIIIDNQVTMHSRKTFERPRRILVRLAGLPRITLKWLSGEGICHANSRHVFHFTAYWRRNASNRVRLLENTKRRL